MASYRIPQPGTQQRKSITNFGRNGVIKKVFPAFDERIVDVQIDEVMSWTVVIDVLKVTPQTRVLAKIEYGSGSSNSVQIVDVADHVDYPVVGDSVRVSFSVEQNFVPGEGSPVATANMAALVSCSLSAEVPAFPFRTSYFVPQPVTGVGVEGVLGPVSAESTPPFTAQAVPARLASYQALLLNGGVGTTYLLFFDQKTVPVNGDSPVWGDVFTNTKSSFVFLNPMSFDNSVQWALSTTPNSLTLVGGGGIGAIVFGELSRRPLGQIVASVQEISGGQF